MNRALYFAGLAVGRIISFCTMRVKQLRPELARREGGFVLALTHVGHLDPIIASLIVRRPIYWMTRREFFCCSPVSWLLHRLGAFSVNRQGIPVSAIRRAVALAKEGNIVGICPEGGRTFGAESAVRGGTIKQGVCSVAIRSAAPVVPCVMLGTADLDRVGPWLPFKRIKLWIAYGEPIDPPAGKSTRATRKALREELEAAYVRLYGELREKFGLDDSMVP